MHNYIYKCFDFSGDGADLLDAFKREAYVFLLDSSLSDSVRGRYSFLGFNPFHVFTEDEGDIIGKLKEEFSSFRMHEKNGHTPFEAGVAGMLSYDYGAETQNIFTKKKSLQQTPKAFFGFYDAVLTIDHYKDKLYIFSTGLPEKNTTLKLKKAMETLSSIEKTIAAYFDQSPKRRKVQNSVISKDFPSIQSNFSKEQYMEAVKKALEYIHAGEIYQVNLSQKFSLKTDSKKFNSCELYNALRKLAPSHFSSYFDAGDFKIISSSPERFLQLRDSKVQTMPMKGTRPRSDKAEKDLFYKNELLHSRKDKAELLMITDLLRNDLGRVCSYGSINVKDLRNIEQYKYVYQATSTVEGELKKGCDGFDLLKACFPGGSITGCPKIRSMQVIEELEPDTRGFYTGSLGYMSFSSNMDFNVLIRSVIESDSLLTFHAGGGIVADSVALDEYNETLVKAQAIAQAINMLSSIEQLPIKTT